MVGKIIAWFLKRAGYELISLKELTGLQNFTYSLDERVDSLEDDVAQLDVRITDIDAKYIEMDGVICSTMECVEEIRDVQQAAAPTKQNEENIFADILNEYLYGYQQKRSDDE